MKYYIFQVKDSGGQNYYVINNVYLGYLGLDCNRVRSILESGAKIQRKYKLIASGDVYLRERALHDLFSSDKRLTLTEANNLISNYKLKKSYSRRWYQIVFPNRNSSESKLAEVSSGFKTVVIPIYKYFNEK